MGFECSDWSDPLPLVTRAPQIPLSGGKIGGKSLGAKLRVALSLSLVLTHLFLVSWSGLSLLHTRWLTRGRASQNARRIWLVSALGSLIPASASNPSQPPRLHSASINGSTDERCSKRQRNWSSFTVFRLEKKKMSELFCPPLFAPSRAREIIVDSAVLTARIHYRTLLLQLRNTRFLFSSVSWHSLDSWLTLMDVDMQHQSCILVFRQFNRFV